MVKEPMKKALECMNNVVMNVQEELIKINLGEEGRERMVKICKGLPKGEKRKLIALLKEYKDVYAGDYEEMPRLDPKLVTHRLNVDPKAKPVKQPARKYRLDVEENIKIKVNKILKVGFIEEIKCPKWLANIVHVKKKGKQIRIYVDFRDLNRAYPKDEFPQPNVNIMVDAATRHEHFSFMDGYSGYNQIFMETANAQKTFFRTPFRNYCYKMMPFRLKKSHATY